jgi:hypothetical protein
MNSELNLILNKLNSIEDRLTLIENKCNLMENHIHFIEKIYTQVNKPFHYIMNKVQRFIVNDKLLINNEN